MALSRIFIIIFCINFANEEERRELFIRPNFLKRWAFEEEKTSQSCNLIRNETQRVSSFIFVFAASSDVDDNDDSDGDDDDGDDGDTFYRFRKTPTTQH